MSQDARKVKEKYERQLLSIPGVSGVGFNGSINVYVKDPKPEVLAFIPREIEGVRVNVIKANFKLLSLFPAAAIYSDRTGRFRPVPGGVSIGHYKCTAGTLACSVLEKRSGEIRGLSNNHVVALDWGTEHVGKANDPILQPGPVDGGANPADVIGFLDKWIPVKTEENNTVDAGIFVSDVLSKSIEDIGKPSESMEPYRDQHIFGSGRTSGVKYSKVTDVDATIAVEGAGECVFAHQIICAPAMLAPGDSGLWVGDSDTNRSVGLGFAGDENLSAINRITIVEDLLNIEVIPPIGRLSLAALLTPFLILPAAAVAYTGFRGGRRV